MSGRIAAAIVQTTRWSPRSRVSGAPVVQSHSLMADCPQGHGFRRSSTVSKSQVEAGQVEAR